MTIPTDPPRPESTDSKADEFDDLARRAALSLRSAAPVDGPLAAIRAGQRRRTTRTIGAIGVTAIVAVGALALNTRNNDPSAPTGSTDVAALPLTVPSTTMESTTDVEATPEMPAVLTATEAGAQTIATDTGPSQVATDGTTVWVLHDSGPISRYDARTGALLGTIPLTNGARAERPVLGFGSLWVTNAADNTLLRIDAVTGAVLATIAIPGDISVDRNSLSPSNVAVGDGVIWVLVLGAPTGGLGFVSVDPATNTVASTIAAPDSVSLLEYGFGSLWAVRTDSALLRIAPTDGREIASIDAPWPHAPRAGLDSMWLVDFDDTLVRIDPDTNTVIARIPLPSRSTFHTDVAFGNGFVWTSSSEAALVKIDPTTNQIIGRYITARDGGGLAVTDTDVWFTDYADNTLYRLPLP